MSRLTIVQGEHAVSGQPDVMISTLLGSCVAACLYDPVARVGGMNHILLGEPGSARGAGTDMSRYGVHAMEVLINAMMAKGAQRDRLRAHLYGGANMVSGLGEIGSSNARFARSFMETERIAIGHCDLGGNSARKVDFMAHDGRSRCTHVSGPVREPAPVARPVAPHGGELELF